MRHGTTNGAPDFERPETTILHAIYPVRRHAAHMISMLMGQEYSSHVVQGDPGGMVPDLRLSLNIRFQLLSERQLRTLNIRQLPLPLVQYRPISKLAKINFR
jgi:hypothetical protein